MEAGRRTGCSQVEGSGGDSRRPASSAVIARVRPAGARPASVIISVVASEGGAGRGGGDSRDDLRRGGSPRRSRVQVASAVRTKRRPESFWRSRRRNPSNPDGTG